MQIKSQYVDNVNMAPKPSSKPYHHGNLRAALIDAGLTALEQVDASALSLRAIARELGVSANAAYRHFQDKDALLSALAAEGFRRFAANQVEASRGALNQLGERRASGLAYVAFAQAHPALFRLMFGRLMHANTDDELRTAALTAFQGLLQASAQDIGTGAEHEKALMVAVARWSLVHGLSHLLLDGQLAAFPIPTEQLIEGVLTMAPLVASTTPASSKAVAKSASKSKAARRPK